MFVLVLWMHWWHCICKFSSMSAHVLWTILYNNMLKKLKTEVISLVKFCWLNSIFNIFKDFTWQIFTDQAHNSNPSYTFLSIAYFQSLFLLQMLIGSSIYVQRCLWEFFYDVIGVQRFGMGLFTGHGTGKGPQKMWVFFFSISNLKMSSPWQNEGIDRLNSKLEIMRDVFQSTLSPLYNSIQ